TNVVMPASTSVRTSVRLALRLKIRSTIFLCDRIAQAKLSNPINLSQRLTKFNVTRLIDSLFQTTHNIDLCASFDRKQERKTESRLVIGVQPLQSVELFGSQRIQPRTGLLSGGCIANTRPGAEIRMRSEQ